jgi:hypothetical protein
MAASRLELISSYGDQTLPRVRFVVHGTSNARDFASIGETGLRFVEGRPTVSTNIVHAQDWTVNPAKQAQSLGGGTIENEPGSVVVCAVPANFHLGYGVFTTAYVDLALKRVIGAPLRYAAARKQLAFYMSADTESSRTHIEREVAGGYSLDQRPQFVLEPQYVVGSFDLGSGFDVLVTQLDVAIRSLEPIEYDRLEGSLRDVFRPRIPADIVLVPTAIRDIIVGTAESIIVSRLRMMRWQGLALLGYTFVEGREEVQIAKVSDMAEHRRRMNELRLQLETSALFTAELTWLKTYAMHVLDEMKVELGAAELEALDD